MGLNRYAKRRDKNEAAIVKALRDFGATVELIDTPCDLLVGYNNKPYLVEVKTPGGRLTPRQKKFAKEWQGGELIVTTDAETVINYLRIDNEASD